MAGRGVDIILGGNPVNIDEARAVRDLGGLAVIGTERHEARRIDNQLRGRSGRQGDPGSSQFFVSMDDDLMRIFGSDRMKNMMNRLGVPDDMPIENRMVSRSIESAQKKVESRHFDVRKHLVEYDDVMNKHRDVIYRRRNAILEMTPEEVHKSVLELVEAEIEQVVSFHTSSEETAEWDLKAICSTLETIFPFDTKACLIALENVNKQVGDKLGDAKGRTTIIEYFVKQAHAAYENMTKQIDNPDVLVRVERGFTLRAIDTLWIEHLDQMSFLRDAIGLRGYGQRDPLVEYKRESYQMFQELLANIQKQVVYNIYKLRDAKVIADRQVEQVQKMQYTAPEKEMQKQVQQPQPHKHTHTHPKKAEPYVKQEQLNTDGTKVGRNDLCPCGSGKKYKHCHGKLS
jgi:preprotein translocase subunit SecA